jgi:hypothetical protein
MYTEASPAAYPGIEYGNEILHMDARPLDPKLYSSEYARYGPRKALNTIEADMPPSYSTPACQYH